MNEEHVEYEKYMLAAMIRKCCHASDLISELGDMDHRLQTEIGRDDCAWKVYDLEELSEMNDGLRDLQISLVEKLNKLGGNIADAYEVN